MGGTQPRPPPPAVPPPQSAHRASRWPFLRGRGAAKSLYTNKPASFSRLQARAIAQMATATGARIISQSVKLWLLIRGSRPSSRPVATFRKAAPDERMGDLVYLASSEAALIRPVSPTWFMPPCISAERKARRLFGCKDRIILFATNFKQTIFLKLVASKKSYIILLNLHSTCKGNSNCGTAISNIYWPLPGNSTYSFQAHLTKTVKLPLPQSGSRFAITD